MSQAYFLKTSKFPHQSYQTVEVMLAIINLKVTHPRQVTEKRWKPDSIYKKPFPKCLKPFFRNKRKCTIFDMKMFCYSRAKKKSFSQEQRKKGLVFSLVLKVRFLGTRDWCLDSVLAFQAKVWDFFISSINDVTKVEGFYMISWIINAFDWLLPMIYWRTNA